MFFNEDSKCAAQLLKQAIPEMVRRGIPTNPYNFTLWYARETQQDAQLVQDLDKEYSTSGQYSADRSEQLFFHYIIKPFFRNVEQTQTSVLQVLSELLQASEIAATCTQDFNRTLTDTIGSIDSSLDPLALKAVLEQLLEQTAQTQTAVECIHSQFECTKEGIESLTEQANTSPEDVYRDPLTRIGNRCAFDKEFGAAMGQDTTGCVLLFIELDNIENINDEFGYLCGDEALRRVGEMLDSLKAETIKCHRYSGKKFSVTFSNSTLKQAVKYGELFLTRIQGLTLSHKKAAGKKLTASIGISDVQPGNTAADLIKRADAALTQARQAGSQRIVCAE